MEDYNKGFPRLAEAEERFDVKMPEKEAQTDSMDFWTQMMTPSSDTSGEVQRPRPGCPENAKQSGPTKDKENKVKKETTLACLHARALQSSYEVTWEISQDFHLKLQAGPDHLDRAKVSKTCGQPPAYQIIVPGRFFSLLVRPQDEAERSRPECSAGYAAFLAALVPVFDEMAAAFEFPTGYGGFGVCRAPG